MWLKGRGGSLPCRKFSARVYKSIGRCTNIVRGPSWGRDWGWSFVKATWWWMYQLFSPQAHILYFLYFHIHLLLYCLMKIVFSFVHRFGSSILRQHRQRVDAWPSCVPRVPKPSLLVSFGFVSSSIFYYYHYYYSLSVRGAEFLFCECMSFCRYYLLCVNKFLVVPSISSLFLSALISCSIGMSRPSDCGGWVAAIVWPAKLGADHNK